MANNNPKIENLKKITDMTPEEKQKFSSKGGKKSQKNRKEAKAWKELAIIMLSAKTNEKNTELLKKYGLEDSDANINSMIIYNLIKKALNGDISAIRELKEITGNKEPENLNVSSSITIKVEDDYGE